MTTIKFGEKEYKVQFGYEITWKSGIIHKLVELTSENENRMENIDRVMEITPELLLLGLQKFHADEFGFNFKNNEGKEQALTKVCDLLDVYFDCEGADFNGLLGTLQKELLENGFLASLFQQEIKKAKKK